MTVRGGKRWWIVWAALGLLMLALGGFLTRAGLQDADQWASVIGVFLNGAGLVVAVYSVVQARRPPQPGTGDDPVQTVHNTIRDSEVQGPALLARDVQRVSMTGAPLQASAPADPDTPAVSAEGGVPGDVKNRVEGSTFHGPLIMGRDLRGIVLSPPSSGGRGRDGAGA
ncbi:hypothetical protein AB0B10_24680 [Micromonospora arborensis]|uniref:hypothetical protein n=1 Tax=Micromonospora arborensis TaxID=2116518 RepID=UPI0033C6CEB2